MLLSNELINELKAGSFLVYPQSERTLEGGGYIILAQKEGEDYVIATEELIFDESKKLINGYIYAPLIKTNIAKLMELLPTCAPKRILAHKRTAGFADKLGLCFSPKLHAIQKYSISPMLVQQSPDEVSLFNSSFEDELYMTAVSVLKEGYDKGYGADADCVKCSENLRRAIAAGYTMITLDASAHMNDDVADMTDERVNELYIPEARYEKEYLGQVFKLKSGLEISYDEKSYKRLMLTFSKAISFICNMHAELIKRSDVDFEVSFYHAKRPITPSEHFFICRALMSRLATFEAFSPRFPVDANFPGGIKAFEQDLSEHAQIAEHFGYKLSLHSEAFKLSVFPILSRLTKGNFHIKLGYTASIEALRLAAMKEPSLFREMHAYSLLALGKREPKIPLKFVPDIRELDDEKLSEAINMDGERQMFNLALPDILNKEGGNGTPSLRERLSALCSRHPILLGRLVESRMERLIIDIIGAQ